MDHLGSLSCIVPFCSPLSSMAYILNCSLFRSWDDILQLPLHIRLQTFCWKINKKKKFKCRNNSIFSYFMSMKKFFFKSIPLYICGVKIMRFNKSDLLVDIYLGNFMGGGGGNLLVLPLSPITVINFTVM